MVMATVFDNPLFISTILKTVDGSKCIKVTLKESNGRFEQNLLRSDSNGFLDGYMVSPMAIPSWLVPGTILKGYIQGMYCTCTYEGTVQSNISILQKIIGDKVKFSYITTSEYE